MFELGKLAKEFEDEMVLLNELFLEKVVKDKKQERDDEFLRGLNEDKLLYLEECLNLKGFQMQLLKKNTI
jgi:hypothetical protein